MVWCDDIYPRHGSQYRVVGERAARLANSTLMDFDDSGYAASFCASILALPPDQYESDAVRCRVLAKVEHILYGRSSRVYNQRFISKMLAHRLPGGPEPVIAVLKSMVSEGLVLEDSIGVFEKKMYLSDSYGQLPDLLEIYRGCCGTSH